MPKCQEVSLEYMQLNAILDISQNVEDMFSSLQLPECSNRLVLAMLCFPTGETLAVCHEMKEGQRVKGKYGGVY